MRRTWLLLCCLAWALPLSAQTVVNPTTVEFTASADHAVIAADGAPVVTRYEVRFFLGPATSPMQVNDLGKPTPTNDVIRVVNPAMFAVPVSPEVYVAKVAAIGPGGEGVSAPSNPFARIAGPSAPGTPRVSK